MVYVKLKLMFVRYLLNLDVIIEGHLKCKQLMYKTHV